MEKAVYRVLDADEDLSLSPGTHIRAGHDGVETGGSLGLAG